MLKIKSLLKRNSFLRLLYSSYLERRYKSLFKKDPRLAANAEFRAVFHRDINWDNPTNLIEKIIWMQFNTDTSFWTRCADKYRVREYIEEKGCGEYLPKLYGHWDKAEDIDFDSLPTQFVLKANNGCGTVLVVKDKNKLNKKETKEMLAKWLKKPFGYLGAQMHYLRIKPCIIAEELLHNDYEDISSNSMVDFKVWCFNGKPECILLTFDRQNGEHKIDLYDTNWKRTINNLSIVGKSLCKIDYTFPKPICLTKILEMSKSLSQRFHEVRIDFYIVNNNPIIGELTFTAGFGNFSDEYYDYLGSKIDLNKFNK